MYSSTGSTGSSICFHSPPSKQATQTLPPIHDLGSGTGTPRAPEAAPFPGRHPCARARPRADPPIYTSEGVRLRRYYIDDVPFDMEAPLDEDQTFTLRQTVDGRTLKYTLAVLQQPERARACGAGARSSADRRPVDPPPVIELRVFEGQGEHPSEWTDITIKHNATFIVCASLENARPIARGRLHTPPNIASLQGVNFAGTNYLERPKQAGYFIFPDLSVRNEGWYRLSFSLLEGTKEAKDADPDRQFPPSPRPQDDGTPKAPLNFEDMATRLDVRSRPFQVFSAKKFPGLSESTELSRLVADQGCRVRIRRDVRMRKHGARKEDGESYEGERRSASRFQTPDTGAYQAQTPIERPRSISRTSLDGSQHGLDHYRLNSSDLTYYGHQPYQHNPMSFGSAGPSPIAPQPILPGTLSATGSTQSYPSYSHAPAQMSLNGFALPQPRHSLDNTNSNYPPSDFRPSLPSPAAFLRSITPDNPKSSPSSSLSIHNLTNRSNGSGIFDNSRKQWILPNESGPIKRSYSPTGPVNSLPLKAGMRPDSLPSIASYTSTDAMEADNNPYSEPEDSYEEQPGTMNYKRANGTTGRKPVPTTYNRI